MVRILPDLIYQQLREHLQSVLEEQPQSNQRGILVTTVQQNRFDSLLYYLHTGLIPWHTANPSPATLTTELTTTCHQHWAQLLDYLQSQRETTTSFYFRLF